MRSGPKIALSYGAPTEGSVKTVSVFRQRLESRLRETTRRDAQVVMDRTTFQGGARVDQEVRRFIADADVIVFLLSPAWLQSDWCLAELAWASRHKIPFLPVSWAPVQEHTLPPELRGRLRRELTDPEVQLSDGAASRTALDQVVGDLTALAPALRVGWIPPRARRRRVQRAVAALSALLALALWTLEGAPEMTPRHFIAVELADHAQIDPAIEALARLHPAIVALGEGLTGQLTPARLAPLTSLGIPVLSPAPIGEVTRTVGVRIAHNPWLLGGGAKGFLVAEGDAMPLRLAGVAAPRLAQEVWLPRGSAAEDTGPSVLSLEVLQTPAARTTLRGQGVVLELAEHESLAEPWWVPWRHAPTVPKAAFTAAVADAAAAGHAWWTPSPWWLSPLLAGAGALLARARPATALGLGAILLLAAAWGAAHHWALPLLPVLVISASSASLAEW